MGKTFKFHLARIAPDNHLGCMRVSMAHCVIKNKLNFAIVTFIKYRVDSGNRWFVSQIQTRAHTHNIH